MESKRKRIIRKLLLFISIYCTQTSFVLNLMFPGRINLIMSSAALFIIAVICVQYRKVQRDVLRILFLVTASIVLTAVTNLHYTGGYVLIIIGYFQAIMFVSAYDRDSFYEDYIDIIKTLAIFSLLSSMLVYKNWLGINKFFPAFYNVVGDEYLNFFVAFPCTSLNVFRINGIWGEAGMFGVFLCFALVIELFYVKRPPKNRNVIILLLACILTLSATVFVIISIVCIVYIFSRKIANNSIYFFFALVPVLAIAYIVIAYFSPGALSVVFEKYETDNISFIGRTAPIIYNINQWLNKPIFGNGVNRNLGEVVEMMSFRGQLYRIKFNTTTSLEILNCFGLTLFSLHMFLVFRFAGRFNCNVFKGYQQIMTIILAIIVMININTQNVVFDQTIILLFMSSYMKDSIQKE